MQEKKAITKEAAKKYQKATKGEKGIMLDQFISLTKYHRTYLSWLLGNHGRKIRISHNAVIEAEAGRKSKPERQREKIYDNKILRSLKKIWLIMGCICGKRLAPILKEIISRLKEYNEIVLDKTTEEKLSKISASTIDRLLKEDKKKFELKGRSHTKPGSMLKSQIPIRTFSEWDDNKPGFLEIDLVGHEGGDPRGEFIQSLNAVDIFTGWAEMDAVRNKAEKWVFEAIEDIKERLPFDLLAIDSDNGGEFINNHLYRYCIQNKITFTRARKYRKNDNCYVEQKNYSVVRKYAGYYRYDTEEELKILKGLYKHLRLYINFFQPVMKLKEKVRIGSKVIKRYDKPKTPYQRVLESEHVSKDKKEVLKEQYRKLNPAELQRWIIRLQEKLQELVLLKEELRKKTKPLCQKKEESCYDYIKIFS
jgi:hypothetical protein